MNKNRLKAEEILWNNSSPGAEEPPFNMMSDFELQAIDRDIARAQVHATLAVAQELRDLRHSIDRAEKQMRRLSGKL